ncbi:N-acetylmuramoyl-L-alanine amidase, partial [Candidatus Sumerlaeota bacterium]|nr:N-acetylmuramoyl-L-alanine amidase [Candidatus Sumerlaeota bacterium]
DTGALGPSGLAEADVNLVLAALVGNRLQSLGAVIRQTRREDRFVSLDDRVDAALEFNADLFISVHHNSVAFQTDPLSDHGPKVFYHYPYSEPLAARIEDELAPNLTSGEKPRVLREVFRVNRNISVCPSVLIEGGFVCNPADEVNLRKTETLETMSDAIARGVVKMFERASDHAAPHPSP